MYKPNKRPCKDAVLEPTSLGTNLSLETLELIGQSNNIIG